MYKSYSMQGSRTVFNKKACNKKNLFFWLLLYVEKKMLRKM